MLSKYDIKQDHEIAQLTRDVTLKFSIATDRFVITNVLLSLMPGYTLHSNPMASSIWLWKIYIKINVTLRVEGNVKTSLKCKQI
jgi:hypothetical protein